jgi:ribosomal protein S12 methylthiotransferase
VGFVSLGCPKNLVDTEVMMGALRRDGLLVTPDASEAEVIVVNTCGFIDAAREESVNTILEMAELKKSGACRRLVVAGCMVQRYPEELQRELPEVDAFLGLDDLGQVAEAVRGERGDALTGGGPATYLYDHLSPRMLAGPHHSAYLKIAEGCDNPCAFCAIPMFRGAFRSRRPDSVVAEARSLVEAGAVELNLIAQDSTHYGSDLGIEDGAACLLERLATEVDGARWIRLFYVYPNRITDRLIEVMATHDNICNYVDIPLQHASRAVLNRMVRGGSADHHRRILERFRRAIPDVALRTTFIVGYPGETDDEFREILEFVEESRFHHAGVFTYSHEKSTRAAGLVDDVPMDVKEERRARVMELQEGITRGHHDALVGRTRTVLCDGICQETEHLLEGRLEGQAPEVDGRVLINDGEARAGQFVSVEMTEAHPHDLVGRSLGPAA